ncbi:MAG: dTMP kinase [Candidatus Puniceispirillaceae bacterium]
MSGYFVTFEGGEGSGKSTQIQRLVERISSEIPGVEPVVSREPGGTVSAESIRDLLVKGAAERWRAATEAMLMSASRHEHVVHILRPALAAGKLVICDRYNDSTRVYQGLVGGVPREDIEALNRLACDGLVPDLTILLDMDVEVGLKRASSRAGDESRFESKGIEFHQKVRMAFLELAEEHNSRFVVIDAARSVDAVAGDVADIVLPRLRAAQLA